MIELFHKPLMAWNLVDIGTVILYLVAIWLTVMLIGFLVWMIGLVVDAVTS